MPKSTARIMIPYHINGLPCKIGVLSYTKVDPWRGSVYSCPSDADYYGYTETEWELTDRKGYMAPWIEKKLTQRMKDEVETAILEYFDRQRKEYYDEGPY